MKNFSLWLALRPDIIVFLIVILSIGYLMKLPILYLVCLVGLAFYGYGAATIYKEGPAWLKKAILEAEGKGKTVFEIAEAGAKQFTLYRKIDKVLFLPIAKSYSFLTLFIDSSRLCSYQTTYNMINRRFEGDCRTREFYHQDIVTVDSLALNNDNKFSVTVSSGQKLEFVYHNKKLGEEALRAIREKVREAKSR